MLTCTFLNNWGARRQRLLFDYIERQASTNAVMAFTEVNHTIGLPVDIPINTIGDDGPVMVNQFGHLQALLADSYCGVFAGENTDTYRCMATGLTIPDVQYGNALFIANTVRYIADGIQYIVGEFGARTEKGPNSRVLQYMVCEVHGERYLIAHFHGIWIRGNTKGDTTERIMQSARVLDILDRLAVGFKTAKVILGGDFNLDINTVALKMLERGSIAGSIKYRNLIREYGISDTRSPDHYRHYNDAPQPSLYADYVLVSEAVTVVNFVADETDVSDHRPLEVTFY